IEVTARDIYGNPIGGASVELSVDPIGNAVLNQPGGLTGPDGRATGSLLSTQTGPRVVKALINGAIDLVDSVTVVFTPGAVASFEWAVNTPSRLAGQFASATLTAKDAQDNVVDDYQGVVDLSTTSTGVGDGVVDWSDADANGTITNLSGDQATYLFVLGDNGSADLRVTDIKAETIQLIAQAGAASGTSSDIDVTHNVADTIAVVTGDGQSATVNTAVGISPRVRVVDEYGNPVNGETVTFNPIAGGGSVDVIAGGGAQNTGITDVTGELQCDIWTLGTIAGGNTLRASIPLGAVPSVDFDATGDPGAGTTLVIAPLSKPVTVNSTDTEVTATLQDAFTNPVPGERVDIVIQAVADGQLANNPARATTGITPTS
ncbi:MAG: Ig-like domain-containing protein, partial [Candidatus Krumholzibacteria bacterium]|nr:Ig-like domain-containing protein [Candidatus Krumholzibacteria bacterium]